LEDYAAVLKADPGRRSAWFECALSYLALGESDRYKAICVAMLARFPNAEDAVTNTWLARTLILAPNNITEKDVISISAHLSYGDGQKSFFGELSGGLYYRAARYAEAVEKFERSGALGPHLVIAKYRLARDKGIRQELARALRDMGPAPEEPRVGTPFLSHPWRRNLELDFRHREALHALDLKE
jgi:hypothetical protein